ncbi:centromere protein X [Lipomyces arxii]|uniref:centromere protein X n=1 Tax=Lipomyces arxii TaxID=56418 RepID=UPI0034CDC64B
MSDSESGSEKSENGDAIVTFNNKTVARLFLEYFEKQDTRISASAVEASAEYLRIFTREAVWRTDKALKDLEADKRSQKSMSSSSSAATSAARARMMEAQDLEKVAGTLVLDF